jgi:hypothetical protein
MALASRGVGTLEMLKLDATKQRVWIDVTDLRQWSGHLTGVQRVVFENMVRLRNDPDIEAEGIYYEPWIDELLVADIPNLMSKLNHQSAEASSQNAGDSAKEKLKHQLKAIYFKLPADLRSRIKRALRAAQQLKHRAYFAKNKFIYSRATKGPQSPVAELCPHDTVLVFGKLWDSTPLVDLLSRKKNQIGFRYIVTVHDLIAVSQQQLLGPGMFYQHSQYLFDTVAWADLILCVSKSTERDVKRFANQLHVPEPQTKVIQLGDTSLTTSVSSLSAYR